jgi:hypothetical protein
MRTIQKLYQKALLTGKPGMEILEDRLVKELPITQVLMHTVEMELLLEVTMQV